MMTLALLQEVKHVGAQLIRIISPIPVNFPVRTCQRMTLLCTPLPYCGVCLWQLLIRSQVHDSRRCASRDHCTHDTPLLLKGHCNLHANLDGYLVFRAQQRFTCFVPVEYDVVTSLPDATVFEKVPNIGEECNDPGTDIVGVRLATHGGKGLLGYFACLDVVRHSNFLCLKVA